jgi:Caspase domain
MQPLFLSWKTIVSVGAALGLLLMVGPTSPSPALASEMGGGHHHGGGWSGGGGGVGVGVGIGVGTILLNEAIRRSQERHQAAEPQGCPPGLVPSRHGCKPAKNKGPEVTKCEPPMQWRKGKGCVPPKGPEVAQCAPPMQMRKGRCVPPKEPEVAKCEHGHGPGCPQPNGPEVTRCEHGKGKDCPSPEPEPVKTVTCERNFMKIGNNCVCLPGFVQHGHDCRPPTVVVVPPPVVVPVGPGPEGPPQMVPAATPPAAPPPPPRQASPVPPKNPAPIQSLAKIEPAANRCLPDDLYDLLEQTYGKPPALNRCPTACLPKPASFTPAELDAAAAKSGINWCENCVQVGGYMPLASVLQLEKAANVTICVNPDMCRLPAAIGGGDAGERVVEIRTVFKDLPAGVKNEGNIAVVVGNQDYLGDLPDNPDGKADADAVMALLVDQLGYKQENIIDLRDATLADFERVFGSQRNPEGELAKRIDKKDPGDVFIYVASHGMVKEDDTKQAYLLPVDAKLDDLDKTAYPMQELYDNLGKIGARTIMLMLEANFAKNLDELINPPNLPELEVEAMPVNPVPGLAVFKASDRDQKTIKDPEYGIGLFTRYMIEGLAGRADAGPLGNDDKRIDTVELYVYTADAVRTAARKSFGLEQKPLLSKIDNLVVGNLTAN